LHGGVSLLDELDGVGAKLHANAGTAVQRDGLHGLAEGLFVPLLERGEVVTVANGR
jgi:hypothetical protein